jgi:hypothetical protein
MIVRTFHAVVRTFYAGRLTGFDLAACWGRHLALRHGLCAAMSLLLLASGLLTGCGNTAANPGPLSTSSSQSLSEADSTSASLASSTAVSHSSLPSSIAVESSSASSKPVLYTADFTWPSQAGDIGIVVHLSADNTELPTRGSTILRVRFTDIFGEAIAPNGSIAVASRCSRAQSASINTLSLQNDTAHEFLYTAKSGCDGEDLVTFDGDWTGTTFAKSLSLSIEPEAFTQLNWLSTTPEQLALKGAGGSEIATLKFRLRSYDDNPILNEEVTFRLIGATGGAALTNTQAYSNAQGEVSVQIASGTSPANITIEATHVLTGVTATASSLVVASGLSAEGYFELAANLHNPAGFNRVSRDLVTLVAVATDKAGNPVPDGTRINFLSPEGGNLSPSCQTRQGQCQVAFSASGHQPADGRVTVLATIKGTENFIDHNGNSLFDAGDVFLPEQHEQGEPFVDANDNGIFDAGEYFVDTNSNSLYDLPNQRWNGADCQHPTDCDDTVSAIDLGASALLILSDWRRPTLCALGDFATLPRQIAVDTTLVAQGLYISDGNTQAENSGQTGCRQGNPLPQGTLIEFSTSRGALTGTQSWTLGNAYRPTGPYVLRYRAPTTPGLDVLSLAITPPDEASVIYEWTLEITP